MTAQKNMYGPAGYTRTEAVRAVLDPRETGENYGGTARFQNLTAKDLLRLKDLLPDAHGEDRQNDAPSFAEMAELAKDNPELTFHGYRVEPSRSDERITIEGFEGNIKFDQAAQVLSTGRYADEFDLQPAVDGYSIYTWWD